MRECLLLALGTEDVFALGEETREPLHPLLLAIRVVDHRVPHLPRTIGLELCLRVLTTNHSRQRRASAPYRKTRSSSPQAARTNARRVVCVCVCVVSHLKIAS